MATYYLMNVQLSSERIVKVMWKVCKEVPIVSKRFFERYSFFLAVSYGRHTII